MVIPVFTVSVPEYQVRKYDSDGRVFEVPNYGIEIPEIYEDNKPNFEKYGRIIDGCLKEHFLGKKVAIRVLGSCEHPNRTQDELIEIIKEIGHDRYDADRTGDRYENIENKEIEIFAMPPYVVKENEEYFKNFLIPFYYWPIKQRGYPVRVDIAIIYNPALLIEVPHIYKGRENELKKDGFVFKDPKNKSNAIIGIIKIE